jgi:hypothetical protein
MEKIAFKMQQEAKVHWRYEWPLKTIAKWSCSEVVGQREETCAKMWLRHAENLSNEGKRYGKGHVGCQVGNGKGSVDLVSCQVGRGDIPDF